MREEVLLEKKFGKPNLFKVPEGYFETLETCVMGKIPKQPRISKRPITRFLRPAVCAACIIAAIITTTIYFLNIDGRAGKHMANISDNIQPVVYQDMAIDEISDYAMFDNDDFYSFIADE